MEEEVCTNEGLILCNLIYRLKMASKRSLKGTQNPILKVILEGIYDEESILFELNGKWPILHKIWLHLCKGWKDGIKTTSGVRGKEVFDLDDCISYMSLYSISWCKRWSFPQPCNIEVTMMPFLLADCMSFEKSGLPKELIGYWEMICKCVKFDNKPIGKICFLTVQESWIEKGDSLGREGIHIEAPGKVRFPDGTVDTNCDKG